jgi:4-amino-4-deoxy-L-arabinose transferase-like glycosyltransferase
LLAEKQFERRWMLWLEWAVLLALVALATFLRYWQLGTVPPGFNSDEAVGAMGGLTTLREGFRYSYEGQGGAGSLGFYFVAASFYLFGPSIAAARGIAAWAGVVSVLANYWAVRELFRSEGLTRARLLAGLSTLGLAVSLWHIQASRVVFAGIGVPFLLLPSVYFLWLGLNGGVNSDRRPPTANRQAGVTKSGQGATRRRVWPFVVSGIFLGALMYIYLSGVFAPPFYAAFFIAQWLVVAFWQKLRQKNPKSKIQNLKSLVPPQAYLTSHFRQLFATGLTAALLLLPLVFVLLTRPELEPGATRVSQAIFLNPQINQGDPWGLLWRSIVGNFGAYGLSLSWLIGQPPQLAIPAPVGLAVFLGFLIALWRGLRGQAVYLFAVLWLAVMLLPSILSPDIIPHNLRTIGATTPVYILAAIFIIWLFETLGMISQRWLRPKLGHNNATWLTRGAALALALALAWVFWQASAQSLYRYFYIFPQTNDAQAAYHVYAVKMAEEINRESSDTVAFILPRNTAAGDIARNFTTDFLTELAQPPAAHYWLVDDETTLPADLTRAAADHTTLRVVKWKTSKHTGADPKQVLPYYLEKYGRYERTDTFEYFDISTYVLETPAPDFEVAEKLTPVSIDFGGQLRLTGYTLGDAGEVAHVADRQAHSNDLLWLRLAWQKTADHAENLKASAQIYTKAGQFVTQIDKLLQSNILQVGSAQWPLEAAENSYFLIPIPPATPPGDYTLRLAVYGEESQSRLSVSSDTPAQAGLVTLADFTVVPAQKPVDSAAVKVALPVKQELLPGLTLVGFETLPGQTVRSGESVGASLLWQAGDKPLPDNLSMSLVVKPGEGDDEWPLSEPVSLAGDYSTSRWQPGELLRGWLSARIPPTLEPGLYKLRLRLTEGAEAEVATLPIGDFQIEGWPRVFDPPQPHVKLGVNFAGQATLVGLDVLNPRPAEGQSETASGPALLKLKAGDTLAAQLYWRAEAEFEQNYTAFIHLIGPDGLLYGQVDQPPGAGAFPTTGWLRGEYITDAYTIPIAPNAPPGNYQIEIGLYNSNTGQRLPVMSSGCTGDACQQDDKILLPGLTVE